MGELKLGETLTIADIERAKAFARQHPKPTVTRDGVEYYEGKLFGGAVILPPWLYDQAKTQGMDMAMFVRQGPIDAEWIVQRAKDMHEYGSAAITSVHPRFIRKVLGARNGRG